MSVSFDPKFIKFATTAASTLNNGLVSYWKLNESSGTLADSKSSNTGTNSGATLGQTGKLGNCVLFDTATDVINFGTGANLRITTDGLTLAAWVKVALASADYGRIISKEGSYIMYANGVGGLSFFNSDKDVEVAGNIDLRDNAWHLVVITYDHTVLKGYIDATKGAFDESYTLNLPDNAAVPVCIGNRSSDLARPLSGYIDEAAIWNRALTQAEITELYNSGTGKTYPF
jgi:hypothetical protein